VKIASLSPAITEILFRFGVEHQIVCTDQFSNYPEDARKIPHVKDHAKISIESLLPHSPDLILTSTVIQERLANDLRAQGMSVIHQDPRTINEIYESIRALGAILDLEQMASEIILSMQQGFNDVKKKASLLPKRPKVYIEEWHLPPMASGNWVPDVARVAGGEQFPIPSGELSREVTLGEVMTFDPDMIVISWCGAGSLADPKLLREREGWSALRAVKSGNIRVIDDSLLNRPGPRLVDGARHLYGWFFELLH